jgi:hypothetical protein
MYAACRKSTRKVHPALKKLVKQHAELLAPMYAESAVRELFCVPCVTSALGCDRALCRQMMPLVRALPGFEKADKKVYHQVVDIRAAFLRKKYPAETSNTYGLLWQLIRIYHADISTVELWDLLPLEQAFLVPVLVDEEKKEALVLILTKRWLLNAVEAQLSGYVVTFLLDETHGTVIGNYVVLSMLTCSIQHTGYRLGKIIMPVANSETDETITGTNRVTMAITKLFELINIAGRYTTSDPSFKVTVKYSVSDGDHRLINACLLVLMCVHIYCTFHFDKAKKCHNKDFVRAESVEYFKAFLKFLRDCSFPILGHWMRTVLLIAELERLGEHEWLRYWRAQWADKILCRSAAAVCSMQRFIAAPVMFVQVSGRSGHSVDRQPHGVLPQPPQNDLATQVCSRADAMRGVNRGSVRIGTCRRVNWTRAIQAELDFAGQDACMQKPFAVAPAVSAETTKKAAKMYALSHYSSPAATVLRCVPWQPVSCMRRTCLRCEPA